MNVFTDMTVGVIKASESHMYMCTHRKWHSMAEQCIDSDEHSEHLVIFLTTTYPSGI